MRLLVLASLAVFIAAPALAHTELRRSDPAAGATLATSPQRVTLSFNERVQVTTLRLKDAGQRVIRLEVEGGFEPAPTKVGRVPTPLGPGRYVIDWAAISADGHPIGGAIPFTVRAQP